MEVSQVQSSHHATIGWSEIQELAFCKALLLIVVCAALQLNDLRAAEPLGDSRTGRVQAHLKSPSALVREAAPPNLSPVPRNNFQAITATLAAAPLYQSDAASDPDAPSALPIHRPIGQLSIDIRPKAKAGSQILPTDRAPQALGELPFVVASRADQLTGARNCVTARGAEAFAYQPLYFEQANLERYGRYHSRLHPATSALRFFATIPALPYAMAMHHPHTAYDWNWPYEAGWAAPRVRELPPFQPRAALVESSVLTGLVFLLP